MALHSYKVTLVVSQSTYIPLKLLGNGNANQRQGRYSCIRHIIMTSEYDGELEETSFPDKSMQG